MGILTETFKNARQQTRLYAVTVNSDLLPQNYYRDMFGLAFNQSNVALEYYFPVLVEKQSASVYGWVEIAVVSWTNQYDVARLFFTMKTMILELMKAERPSLPVSPFLHLHKGAAVPKPIQYFSKTTETPPLTRVAQVGNRIFKIYNSSTQYPQLENLSTTISAVQPSNTMRNLELCYFNNSSFALMSYDFMDGDHRASSVNHFLSLFRDLQSLHKMGFVHGDIRLSNLVFLQGLYSA